MNATDEFHQIHQVHDAALFFREALSEALFKERVTVTAFTEVYLVGLLAHRVTPDQHSGRVMSQEFAAALAQQDHQERVQRFRVIGDTALLLAGLFWERALHRPDRPCHLPLYIRIGERAYAHLSGIPFQELASQFEGVADSLVRFSCDYLSKADDAQRLVQWCSYWYAAGNRHAARMLAERGIFVTAHSAQTPLS